MPRSKKLVGWIPGAGAFLCGGRVHEFSPVTPTSSHRPKISEF